MYKAFFDKQEPDNLKQLFKNVGENSHMGNKVTQVFNAVSERTNWKLAELHERPEDVFTKIEECKVDKQWTAEQKFFFKSILKFVTSRNYFAHHYYLDHNFESHTSELCGDIVKASLHTVLYMASILLPDTKNKTKGG